MAVPVKGPTTSGSKIEVDWTALTLTSAIGGSPITSYNLYWDNGAGSTNYALIDSLVTSYTIMGLTSGSTYKFKVRA